MCLILLAWRARPYARMVVAANRDEFHARPAAPAGFWADPPGVLAGKDLEAGGTWMGVSRSGRFAAVTNYRGGRDPAAAESRGALVTRFLAGRDTARAYVESLTQRRASYSGFNLLACDGESLWWLSNRDGGARELEPGHYGLGNLLLDSPDVEQPKARFNRALQDGIALEPLYGVLEPSRLLAPEYGTRCSTVLVHSGKGLTYAERSFAASGDAGETVRFEINLQA